MRPVTIYTRGFCGYCTRALALLRRKGVAFTEIDIGCVPGAREEMIQRALGRRTVPQIFVGDTHIGGCDDLHALEREGRLDGLLTGT